MEIADLLRLEICFLVCLQLLESIFELVNIAIRNVGARLPLKTRVASGRENLDKKSQNICD